MWKKIVLPVALLLAAGLLLTPSLQAQQKGGRAVPEFLRRTLAASLTPTRTSLTASFAVAAEAEPNDDPASATPAALGDTLSGAIDPVGDGDFYSVFLAAGTNLDADIDAAQFGSSLDATLALYAPDGISMIVWNDDWDGLDSRIRHVIGEQGTYYLEVRSLGDSCGGSECTYNLNLGTWEPPPPPPPGPGDPTSLVEDAVRYPLGITTGRGGSVYVADYWAGKIRRLCVLEEYPAWCAASQFLASDIPGPRQIRFDGYENLLVVSDLPGVLQVSPDGQVSEFIGDVNQVMALAVAPNGDIWVAAHDDQGSGLRVYDSFGSFLERHNLDVYVVDMGFGPGGHLYLSDGNSAIWRYDGSGASPALVDPDGCCLLGFAIDEEGTFYVADIYGSGGTFEPRIVRFGADGTVLDDPFARAGAEQYPFYITFGRGFYGVPNSRLFFTVFDGAAGHGEVREVNPVAVTAPGWDMWPSHLAIATPTLPDGLMGYDYDVQLTLSETGLVPSWSVVSGSLPPGLVLNGRTGQIGAYPKAVGTFTFRVRAVFVQPPFSDRLGEKSYSLTVREPHASRGDVADALFGVPGTLEVGQQRYLDMMGNHNGSLDIGDWRAFVAREGLLPSFVPGTVKP